jgi:hypothetical protein
MRTLFGAFRVALCSLVVLSGGAKAADVSAHALEVDQKAKCLALDWDNDTKKRVCWSAQTKFSVLETKEVAKPADVRVGSYLRIKGEEKDGTLWAAEIVIWKAASNPEPK